MSASLPSAVEQLLLPPEFSFSFEHLMSASLLHQQQQHTQPTAILRLPMGTCAAAAAGMASAADMSNNENLMLNNISPASAATADDECWDAMAYMDGDNFDAKPCNLVPQLNTTNTTNNNDFASAATTVAGATAAAAAANHASLGDFELMLNNEIIVGRSNGEVVMMQEGEGQEGEGDDDDDDDDDEEEESLSSTSPLQQQQRKQQARQQVQQQLQQVQQQQYEPSQFSHELLHMSVREMHQYLKRSNFTKEEVAQLKAERRRMKNRTYARTARCKRKTRQGALETTVQQAQQERQQLEGEVSSLRTEVSLYKRKLAKAEQILRSHGLSVPW